MQRKSSPCIPGLPAELRGIDEPIDDREITESPIASRGSDTEKPDYPGAEAFLEAMHFKSWHASIDRQVTQVIIHITAGQANYRNTARYFQNPTDKGEPRYVSAHYIVGQGGEVVQAVRHNNIAYHACKANGHSIGIEHSARPPRAWGDDDPGLLPTRAQYESSARLVRWLCDRYQLPILRQHILGHCEVDPDTAHSDCPSGAWDWDLYMELLRNA